MEISPQMKAIFVLNVVVFIVGVVFRSDLLVLGAVIVAVIQSCAVEILEAIGHEKD